MSKYTRETPGLEPIQWKSVQCPICGAAKGKPCDATARSPHRTTHLERQWRAIDQWWADAGVFWNRTPCTVKDCPGKTPGIACMTTNGRPHLPRIRKAERASE